MMEVHTAVYCTKACGQKWPSLHIALRVGQNENLRIVFSRISRSLHTSTVVQKFKNFIVKGVTA